MKKFIFSRTKKDKGFNFNKITYGILSFKSISFGYISKKQKENIEQFLKKNIKNYKFNILFNKIRTKKSLETRMGGGKGSIYDEVYFIKPGFILLEIYGISMYKAFLIAQIIKNKIPIKIRLITI